MTMREIWDVYEGSAWPKVTPFLTHIARHLLWREGSLRGRVADGQGGMAHLAIRIVLASSVRGEGCGSLEGVVRIGRG